MSAQLAHVERVGMVAHMCTIDESGGPQTTVQAVGMLLRDWSGRDIAIFAPELVRTLAWQRSWIEAVTDLADTLVIVCTDIVKDVGGDWVSPEELTALVDKWHAALVDQTTGHTHAAFTRGEHDTDELLSPILSMPPEQLAELGERVAVALEADERVPFLVWSTFKRIITPLLRERPAGEVLQLRTQLGAEIAELIMAKLPREDLVAAMAAALAWRSAETLKEVKVAVQQGGQPRVRGRQSCLFADVDDPATGQVLATVIL